MNERDTVLGGGRGSFPTTMWSDILSAGDPSDAACRERWNRLIQNYWKPVYAFIRATWRKQVEDAKDLTQAFFTYFLQKDYLSRMRPERGTFRSYLRQALRHFLVDAARYQASRQPSTGLVALDGTFEELDRIGLAAQGETPEQLFDREWFATVFDASVKDLQSLLLAQGKERYFDVFRAYCLGEDRRESPTYGEVAEKVGLKETDVRNHLTFCRNALRQILRARIRDYVSSDAEVDDELQQVLNR